MNDLQESPVDGQRGPADHNIREQIIAAAYDHFAHYGYGKTTVSDLAKAIGFSKAYIYKFFDSKQAIGEAICSNFLSEIIVTLEESVSSGRSATEKFRIMAETLTDTGVFLFSNDRKLYDIAIHSCTEKWSSSLKYIENIEHILARIILEGRESGEFERKTPLDETCRAIMGAMKPFVNPVMLQYNLDDLPRDKNEMISLVLRSLAP
ncbi:TetR/AcrR family transcriptional regulator [Sphingomonas oligophenolica]